MSCAQEGSKNCVVELAVSRFGLFAIVLSAFAHIDAHLHRVVLLDLSAWVSLSRQAAFRLLNAAADSCLRCAISSFPKTWMFLPRIASPR